MAWADTPENRAINARIRDLVLAGKSVAEIAEATGLKIQSVWSRVGYARKRDPSLPWPQPRTPYADRPYVKKRKKQAWDVPPPAETSDVAVRQCRKCFCMFLSEHRGNRICARCKETAEWREALPSHSLRGTRA
jgi:hypothetical protein